MVERRLRARPRLPSGGERQRDQAQKLVFSKIQKLNSSWENNGFLKVHRSPDPAGPLRRLRAGGPKEGALGVGGSGGQYICKFMHKENKFTVNYLSYVFQSLSLARLRGVDSTEGIKIGRNRKSSIFPNIVASTIFPPHSISDKLQIFG